eukprot:gene29168-35201_t
MLADVLGSDELLEEALEFWIGDGYDSEQGRTTSGSSSPSLQAHESKLSKSKKVVKAVRSARKPKSQQKLVQVGEQAWVATMPQSVHTFDRTNYLIYLPTIVMKHLNSGDITSLRNVLKSRSIKNMEFLAPYIPLPILGYFHLVKFYEMILAYHPDAVSFVTSLAVYGNEICSTFSFKGTDNVVINKHLSQQLAGVETGPYFSSSRGSLADKIERGSKSAEELERVKQLERTNLDLTVYGKGLMRIIFNEHKKIKRFELTCSFVDVKVAPHIAP